MRSKTATILLVFMISLTILLTAFRMDPSIVRQVSAQNEPFIFEDDFESGDFSRWDGFTEGQKGTPTHVRSKPYAGDYCARFTSQGDASYCYNFLDGAPYTYVGYEVRVVPSGLVADNSSIFFCSLICDQPVLFFGWGRIAGEIRWLLKISNSGTWELPSIDVAHPSTNQWYHVGISYDVMRGGLLTVEIDGGVVYEGEILKEEEPYWLDAMSVGIVSVDSCKTSKVYVDNFYMLQGWE